MVMADGRLQINATDATATDAARTDDSVEMMASWKDEAGNTYEVRCCAMLAAHGMEFPTFGGVVTNHILHGFTRIGTALMPSEYTYFGFWGKDQKAGLRELAAIGKLPEALKTLKSLKEELRALREEREELRVRSVSGSK